MNDLALTTDQLRWIDEVLATRRAGERLGARVHRDMPWALVAEIRTDSGSVWFKENRGAFRYEGPLLRLLGSVVPHNVLVPLAIDDERARVLLPEGGPDGEAAGTPASAVVDRMVEIQRAMASRVEALLQVGVPDMRPGRLPAVVDRVIDHPQGRPWADRLSQSRDAIAEMCQEFAVDATATLVDTDLGPRHAFAGPPIRLFDWADAVVSHPLCTIRPDGDDETERIAHAWGHRLDERIVRIGRILNVVLRLAVWTREPSGTAERFPNAIPYWSERLVLLVESSRSWTDPG